jgi:hypothetical protein
MTRTQRTQLVFKNNGALKKAIEKWNVSINVGDIVAEIFKAMDNFYSVTFHRIEEVTTEYTPYAYGVHIGEMIFTNTYLYFSENIELDFAQKFLNDKRYFRVNLFWPWKKEIWDNIKKYRQEENND